jgi:hypothetical protein
MMAQGQGTGSVHMIGSWHGECLHVCVCQLCAVQAIAEMIRNSDIPRWFGLFEVPGRAFAGAENHPGTSSAMSTDGGQASGQAATQIAASRPQSVQQGAHSLNYRFTAPPSPSGLWNQQMFAPLPGVQQGHGYLVPFAQLPAMLPGHSSAQAVVLPTPSSGTTPYPPPIQNPGASYVSQGNGLGAVFTMLATMQATLAEHDKALRQIYLQNAEHESQAVKLKAQVQLLQSERESRTVRKHKKKKPMDDLIADASNDGVRSLAAALDQWALINGISSAEDSLNVDFATSAIGRMKGSGSN